MTPNHVPASVAIIMAVLLAGVRGAGTVTALIKDEYTHGSIELGIGQPSTNYKLLVDPGSSNTWVGAGKAYVATSSSQKTSEAVAVQYGSGSFKGSEYDDTITLGGVGANQSIGVASQSEGFDDGTDGILGVGPVDLTEDTLSPDTTQLIPTVTDNFYSEGDIDSRVVSITNTEITFGPAADADVTYVPITKAAPASTFWGFDASISYGTGSLQGSSAGIIDHGTTLNLLQTSAYKSFLGKTGAKEADDSPLPSLESCDNLDPLVFVMDGMNFTIPVDKYRWPANKNEAIGGKSGVCYLAVGDIGSDFNNYRESTGLRAGLAANPSAGQDDNVAFMLGWNTLKHYVTILDGAQSRIGIRS